jgi:signal transduction histidine kinase
MTQLFHNLIGNAIKFTRDEIAPKITISHRMLQEGEIRVLKSTLDVPYIEIEISDNGIGFDAEFSEQIFVIFQRLNEKKKYPGTGIGLALCKRIVTNHKGFISAHSREDGATFKVILPIR